MAGVQIDITGDASKATAALNGIASMAESVAERIRNGFQQRIGQRMFDGLAEGAREAFSKVVEGVKSALDAGSELTDQIARTGASGKNLVILGQAFKNAGMEASNIGPSLNRMQKALAGVNEDGEPTSKAFEKLGLSIGELAAMDPANAFVKIGDAIAGIPDPAKRAEAAIGLFGKKGGELLGIFTDSAAWNIAKEQVGGLADTMGNYASAMDGVSDDLNALDNKTKELYANIAVTLIPTLKEVIDMLKSVDTAQAGEQIGSLIAGVAALSAGLAKIYKYSPTKIIVDGLGAAGDWWGQNSKIDPKEREKILQSGRDDVANYKPSQGEDHSKAAIAAKVDQINAEVAYASAIKESQKAYDAARKSYESGLSRAEDKRRDALPLEQQVKELNKAEAKLREGYNDAIKINLPGASASTIGKALESAGDSPTKGRDLEITTQILDIENKRFEVTEKLKKSQEEAAAKLSEANTKYSAELALINAQVEGNAAKVRHLQQETAIREKIAELVKAGVDPKEADKRARALEASKAALPLAEARRKAEDTREDASAVMGGKAAEDALKARRRSQELQDKTGMKKGEADSIAAKEADLEKLRTLKGKQDGLHFQSSIGKVSDMQRIGGGGGVVASGLDIQRQQTSLQRQMVTLLSHMLTRTPHPTISDY